MVESQSGKTISVYFTPESAEILKLLKERGDNRSRSAIYNEALLMVYGALLRDDLTQIMTMAVQQYMNRQNHLSVVKAETPEEYTTIQKAWLSAAERFGKFRLIFPDCSVDEMYTLLENERPK